MAKRITIVNFKGGVGKTTLAVHLGCYLARRNGEHRVLFVDVDHQSTLSIIVMNSATTANNWEQAAASGETVNKIFAHYTTQGAPMPGGEIVHKNPFGPTYPNLDLVPAQLELDDTEIDLAATTIGNPFVSEWRKRTLLCRWLQDSGVDDAYDYVVFDCPPATKLVSQNAIAASHAYAVPVIPDAVSMNRPGFSGGPVS
jgi:chromosome partitioning protein